VILLGSAFFIGFLITSLFGNGGAIISYAILAPFMDIKSIILTNMYAGATASIFVLLTDRKSVNLKIIKYVFKYAIVGLILGILIFKNIESRPLMLLYSMFIILVGINGIVRKDFKIDAFWSKISIVIGGFAAGLFGIGGPAFSIGVKNKRLNKSETRSTLTVIFLVSNILRGIAFFAIKVDGLQDVASRWWVVFPVCLGVMIGYFFHKRISQKKFDIAGNWIIFISGVFYFFNSLS